MGAKATMVINDMRAIIVNNKLYMYINSFGKKKSELEFWTAIPTPGQTEKLKLETADEKH